MLKYEKLTRCHMVQGAESMLPSHIEVAYIPFEMGGPQPGLYLYTQAARMMRPVKQNSSQAPELIGTLEQYNMSIWSVLGPLCHLLSEVPLLTITSALCCVILTFCCT